MKNTLRIISAFLLTCMLILAAVACVPTETPPDQPSGESVDYAAQVKLDMSSAETLKQEVTVKLYIDGDTTHFNVPTSVSSTGVLKARYLAINTPESTGKIEEYGKKASSFTREKLESATSIIIESDDNNWNLDSTGGRHLVWIWYKSADSEDYRNLNIEILQNGLAIASNSANNRYGDVCMAAINQARAEKLHVYSGQKDPDYYYGTAVELTLKELRSNLEEYNNIKVAFSGVITKNDSNSVYIESFDAETNMYYGISVYYGFNLSGEGLEILTVGNEARIVGTVQYYEGGGTYQVSGLSYRQMKPDDPENIQLISKDNPPAYVLTDANTFKNATVEIEREEDKLTLPYAEAAMNTSIEMKNLTVKSIYTTTKEDSSSKGAMTLTCEVDGITVDVRTVVLLDESGNIVTESAYAGKNINVRGIVDCYEGSYQIKVFSTSDITINN